MRLSPTSEFLSWAAARHVVPDTRYSAPSRDYYLLRCGKDDASPADESRYWLFPYDNDEHDIDEVRLFYVSAALSALDAWQTCGVLKKERVWPRVDTDPWEAATLARFGIPDGYDGALFFTRNEFAGLFAIVLALSAFGWCVAQDVFVIPDHGRQILLFDHDLDLIGDFADAAARERYTWALAEQGIRLPENPPDAGFPRPAWMPPAAHGAESKNE